MSGEMLGVLVEDKGNKGLAEGTEYRFARMIMPERAFLTETWDDDWFQELDPDQKLLFIYLWTNSHCNQAGLYQITPSTIAFETNLDKAELPNLLKALSPKIEWYPDHNYIWVRSFLRHQTKSPKFIIAAIKTLDNHRVPDDIRSPFELYNEELLRGIAPSEHVSPTKRECVIIRDNFYCQYCGKEIRDASDYEMDHIIPVVRGGKDNYLNLVASCRDCNQKKLDQTPQEAGLKPPTPSTFHGAQATYILRTNATIREKWLKLFPDRYKVIESILNNIEQYYSQIPSSSSSKSSSKSVEGVGVGELSEEKEIIRCLTKLKGWQADEDDVLWLQGLRSECPGFTLAECKACVDYYSGRAPPKHKGIWKNRFRNWMVKKREFEMKGGKSERKGVRPKPQQERLHPFRRIPGGDDEGES